MRVVIGPCGEIISVYDKETQIEWAAEPLNMLRLYQDIPANYEAWDIDSMRKEIPLSGAAVVEVTESGPLFAEVKIERKINRSSMIQWIRMEENSRVLTFRTQIDWQETQKLLKVDFPVNIQTDELLSEIQYGFVKRPNHKSRQIDKDRFEVCNHKWSALAEQGRGCAVLNNSKYRISCNHNIMELTLLRAPLFPDEAADQGLQEFIYAFTFWNTPFAQAPVSRQGYELNTRILTAKGIGNAGAYLGVSEPAVIIDCVKRAENRENAIVIRAYESTGSRRRTKLVLNIPCGICYETNMLEEIKQEIQVDNAGSGEQSGKVLEVEFGPFEVKTFLVKGRGN